MKILIFFGGQILMIKRKWFKLTITVTIMVVLAIVLFSIFNNGKNIKNSQDLINELKLKGYNIENVKVTTESLEWFKSYNGKHEVIKANDIYINYYEFENEEQAKAATKLISKDGNKVDKTYINWGTAVKFYRKGNIIVIYSGTSFKMLWDLRTIMGKSIASSSFAFLLFNKFFR